MELNIRGEKIVVTKAIKDYVMEKLSKLDKYFDSERDFKINRSHFIFSFILLFYQTNHITARNQK